MPISDLPKRNTFQFFRKVWSPRAAFHLTRVRLGADWKERLISALWLMNKHIPLSGAAPSMNFKGLPYANL